MSDEGEGPGDSNIKHRIATQQQESRKATDPGIGLDPEHAGVYNLPLSKKRERETGMETGMGSGADGGTGHRSSGLDSAESTRGDGVKERKQPLAFRKQDEQRLESQEVEEGEGEEQGKEVGSEEGEDEDEKNERRDSKGGGWKALEDADRGGRFEAIRENDDEFLDDFARELDGDSSCDDDADRASIDASRENDDILDEFARELDEAASGGEGGGGEGEAGKEGGEENDAEIAYALQEEEWRRDQPPLPGVLTSRPLPRHEDNTRFLGSLACSTSSSSSIFHVGAGRTGGGSTSNSSSKTDSGGASGGNFNRDGARHGGQDAEEAAYGDGGDHDAKGQSPGARNPDKRAPGGSGGNGGGSSPSREALGAGAGERLPRAGTGKGEGKGKGKGRASTAPAWPPGGLGEGEGLRINDLPDEIVDKVASFSSLPRLVSKRIEGYRVKVVRERVIGALESSAKLPALKAREVEDAIFVLCGRSVPKAYKAKAREMSFNLRVGKNDPLRERLLSGSLPPEELIRMSSNELAPLSVRRERERFAKKRIREVTSSRDSPFHTVTDRFTCQECGYERTHYRTWRRKAVVDRVRVIVQCLQCRHSWEL